MELILFLFLFIFFTFIFIRWPICLEEEHNMAEFTERTDCKISLNVTLFGLGSTFQMIYLHENMKYIYTHLNSTQFMYILGLQQTTF